MFAGNLRGSPRRCARDLRAVRRDFDVALAISARARRLSAASCSPSNSVSHGALDLDITRPSSLLRRSTLSARGRRETLALVGPSGAGKTTVLRASPGSCGRPRGRIALAATPGSTPARVDLPPERRRVGLVFQDYALFPHLSVRAERRVRRAGAPADELLDRFGIAPPRDARPGELSGGERQRVALARALAREPERPAPRRAAVGARRAHARAVRAELQRAAARARPADAPRHARLRGRGRARRPGRRDRRRADPPARHAERARRPAGRRVRRVVHRREPPARRRRARDGALDARTPRRTARSIFTTEEGAAPSSLAVYPWDVSISARVRTTRR